MSRLEMRLKELQKDLGISEYEAEDIILSICDKKISEIKRKQRMINFVLKERKS